MRFEDTVAHRTHFPAPSPPILAVRSHLERLEHWRMGASATAIAIACLLPFGFARTVSYLAAMGTGFACAATMAIGCHLAREFQLARLAIYPEFAHLPELAHKRGQLSSPRSRAALARWLRETAATTQPPNRFDCCPVLCDRVADVRADLYELAGALELHHEPDPVCVALIGELLSDGASPLYNPNVPATDLQLLLARLRVGMIATDEDGRAARRR